MAKSLRCLLILLSSSRGTSRFVVDDKACVVGRSEDCDIIIDDPNVSRKHLVLRARGEIVTIEDLESSHGTFVNGQQLAPRRQQEIGPTDSISFGKINFILKAENLERTLTVDAVNNAPIGRNEKRGLTDLMDAARFQHQEMLKKSQQHVDTMIAAASNEASHIKAEAQFEGEETIRAAKNTAAQEAVKSYEAALQDQRDLGEKIVQEAHLRARVEGTEIKERLMREAQIEAESLRNETKEQIQRQIIDAELKASALTSEAKLAGQKWLEELKTSNHKLMIEKIETEGALSELQDYRQELQHKCEGYRDEIEKSKSRLVEMENEKSIVEDKARSLNIEITKRVTELEELNEKKTTMTLSLDGIKGRLHQQEKDLEAQRLQTLLKIENETAKKQAEQKARIDKDYAQELDRISKLQREYVTFVASIQEKLVKHIGVGVQSELSLVLTKDQQEQLSKKVSDKIAQTVSELAGEQMIQSDMTKSALPNSSHRHFRWALASCIAGAFISFQWQAFWMDRKTSEAQVALQKKPPEPIAKFEPEQDDRLRDNYTESVLYTRTYTETYLSQEFQQKLFKALSKYLLTTWKTEEIQTVQTLSAAVALVKALEEKKQSIHPQLAQKGIDQMHEMEQQTQKRISQILGSDVRLEAFHKFEHRFYQDYVAALEDSRHPTKQ